MKKGIFNLLSMSILFFVNQGYAQQINSHLQANSSLQNHVCSILKENIKKIDAINGQIIIMDCKSGEIKAMVNLVKDKFEIKSTTSQLSQPTGNNIIANIAHNMSPQFTEEQILTIFNLSVEAMRLYPNENMLDQIEKYVIEHLNK